MNRFPDQLDLVPAEQQLPEKIGLGFGGVAIGSALVVIAYALKLMSKFNQDEALFAAGALAVGALCGYLEYRRRRLPLTLVPLGDEIGAYRAGRFVQSFTRGQTTWYQLSWVNTIRELGALGMAALSLTFTAPLFLASLSSLKFSVPAGWMLGGAIAADLLLYSSILTRILSKQYYLPSTVAKGTVAFSKSSLKRFGW
jgi:hypothetical protein